MRKLFALVAMLGLLICACSRSEDKRFKIDRLDLSLADYKDLTSTARDSLLNGDKRPGVNALFYVIGSEVTDSALTAYSDSRAVKVFTADVRARIFSLDSVEGVLGKIDANMKATTGNSLLPIHSIVSPYNQSVIIVDSVMLVGLNHYLGADYPGYGYFEPYQRRYKSIDRLPVDVTESLLSVRYPFVETEEGATLLDRMIYEGAKVMAMTMVVPGVSAKEVLGYDDNEWEWLRANEQPAWNALISRQLLYSIDPMVADRLIMPSPRSSLLNPDAPGRIGRYIGYRIVEEYLKNNSSDKKAVGFILSPEFYNSADVLPKSKYTGNR